MYRARAYMATALLLLAEAAASAGTSLLYLEAQGVAGYSTHEKEAVFYSMHQDDVMQKPSIGFDYIQRFSGETGDFASLALQGRAAYDEGERYRTEPQLYNAYINGKFPFADIWAGHNRPALGISSYLDSHALLLPSPAMLGFGFDRDWGAGLSRDFSFGDFRLSSTTGSGMPVYYKPNYLFASRFSVGVLNQDNYNIGFSAAYGKVLETMGYELMYDEPMRLAIAGIDGTLLWDYFELRIEGMAGEKEGERVYLIFARFSLNLMEENRLKLELQPVYTGYGEETDFQLYSGISFIATSDLTCRLMHGYDDMMEENKYIFQVYYYLRVL